MSFLRPGVIKQHKPPPKKLTEKHLYCDFNVRSMIDANITLDFVVNRPSYIVFPILLSMIINYNFFDVEYVS